MSNPLFRNESFHIVARAMALAALTGCASVPDPTTGSEEKDSIAPVRAEMRIDHALPVISGGETSEEMLDGRLELGTPKGLFDYGLRYRIRQGKLFRAVSDGEDDIEKAQEEVALQTIEQTVGSTLRLPAGPPVRLALTRREQTRLGFRQDSGTSHHKQATQARMQWSPGSVDLQVQWSQPKPETAGAAGVDCDLQAGLTLPAGFVPLAGGSVLELSGQRCRAQAPDSAQFDLARWGATWRWGKTHNSALRLLHTDSASSRNVPGESVPNYELDLHHAQALPGGWQAAANVSLLRRQESPQYPLHGSMAGDGTDWSANLALTRELDLMAVTARWARAAERLWFATATRQVARDRFSLALDFGAWLTRLWPRVESEMDVSWDWRQDRSGDADKKLSWNMLIGW